MRSPGPIAAAACLVAALAACGSPATEKSPRGDAHEKAAPEGELTAVDGPYFDAPAPTRIEVSVPVGGGCEVTGTATAITDETAREVRVRAYVRRPPGAKARRVPGSQPQACPANLIVQRAVVELSAPLGDRRVVDAATGDELQPRPRG